ncbi:hypothetical protein APHNP_0330 [Anaplasma phagocytophilum str. ApNP]|uniref:Uncharacterized protein n=2 Tax=Anaplasma phagocytophilum TaxID=948 RepID=A0A0F3NFX1_ANAPH|nr:hypothetical protein APHMUC_0550 [Anaplasma phagocytophilum str. ApMUC09]KJV66983.1 hypothetical protein APHNP_0330 [Anaplasma phagocytophilum str. ApNP]
MSTQFYAVQPTSRDCGIKKCQYSSSFVFHDLARMSGSVDEFENRFLPPNTFEKQRDLIVQQNMC